MQFLQSLPNGEFRLRGHPGWLTGDTPETSRPLTAGELVDHGFGLEVIDTLPDYDAATQAVVANPINTWPTTKLTATKTYTILELPPVPLAAITPRQLLLTLYSIGVTEAQIDAALVGDPIGMIEWKKASTFNREHPLIGQMAILLGLPPAQVDALWAYASDIK